MKIGVGNRKGIHRRLVQGERPKCLSSADGFRSVKVTVALMVSHYPPWTTEEGGEARFLFKVVEVAPRAKMYLDQTQRP